jgi:hypothetical protein
MSEKQTREYQAYKLLQHWKPVNQILTFEQLFDKESKYYPLFKYMYNRTKNFYARFPLRKNGEPSFIHPINIVLALKEAKVTDEVILLAGLTHDIVEERVDLYRDENKITEKPEGIVKLDVYEKTIYPKVKQELIEVCNDGKLNAKIIPQIVDIIRLLTRHKRDFYYHSISNIYNNKNEELKEKSIMIKLADRTHNILSIECFSEEQRMYECFKNLFILNSTKKYILEKYGISFLSKKPMPPLAKLFKRCAKATYDAFFTICDISRKKGIDSTTTMLQLAFKKFALEQSGANKVTDFNTTEVHPMRLYGGIIRKYDFRLHHQWEKLEKIKKNECEYAKKFFADFNFTPDQLHAILDYKDAYALRETITYLLYWPEYVLGGFEYSDLFTEH